MSLKNKFVQRTWHTCLTEILMDEKNNSRLFLIDISPTTKFLQKLNSNANRQFNKTDSFHKRN